MTVAGLSSAEAARRLAGVGPNALPRPRYRLARLVLRQFRGIFNLLLITAAAVTFALGEVIDGTFILLFVAIGTGLNVFQEWKSSAAVDRLQSYLVHTITVRRDGRDHEVSTEAIVPGDILSLETGDIVPADAVLRQARDLSVDETTFTGESVPVVKLPLAPGQTAGDENTLLQGVIIRRGNALAEVTATGPRTRLADISARASSLRSGSDLVRGIDRISSFILRTTVLTLAVVVVANLVIEGGQADLPELLIFAVALAVSVIPEALPLVLTFTLSRGAMELARRGAIVKRLTSVQDLGSVNLLCTDKTGTITENLLVHQDTFAPAGAVLSPVLLARLAATDLEERIPEPFDRATDEALGAVDRARLGDFQTIEEEAFDPALRSNGVRVRTREGGLLHIRRGSPEVFIAAGLVDQDARRWLAVEERAGHRVLGLSVDVGSGVRFGGFVSFADRLKRSTAATLAAARELDLAVTVITGDALVVSRAIGEEAGLVSRDDQVIDATEFLALPAEVRAARLGDIRVFARTTPEQKLEIITALKARFKVGYLGEGINDAPALKAANVSMVVESASDVARETADIALLRPDLGVIVDGIRIGRETHANTLKYIRATLISNFGNFYAVAIASLFIDFLPMLPKQLLLLNLLSDFPMMAIAFDRVARAELARPQRYDFRALYITFVTLGLVSTVFDFIYFGLFYRISPEVLQTNWFIGSVVTELMLIFSIRSLLPIEKAGWPALSVVAISVFAFGLTIALPTIPQSAAFFGFQPPTRVHLAMILSLAVAYLVATEAIKRPLIRALSVRNGD